MNLTAEECLQIQAELELISTRRSRIEARRDAMQLENRLRDQQGHMLAYGEESYRALERELLQVELDLRRVMYHKMGDQDQYCGLRWLECELNEDH